MPYADFLVQTATIQNFATTIRATGEVITSYTTGTSYPCRFNPVTGEGEEIETGRVRDVSRHKIFFDSDAPITEQTRLLSASLLYNVLRVDTRLARTGGDIHHYEVIAERMD